MQTPPVHALPGGPHSHDSWPGADSSVRLIRQQTRQPGPETASAADECSMFAKRQRVYLCHIYFHIAALPPQALPNEDT